MALNPTPTPARWRNPQWKGKAGTFAVVIGVSRYLHLKGGPAPVADTYDLGQLDVAALTAYRFFNWLANSYVFEDAPLAECWLLLAPNGNEKPLMGGEVANAPDPTFDACSNAIGEWFAAMGALDVASCQASRAVFFFSGHGIEVLPERPMLLPSDYLVPPNCLTSRAIGTYNLTTGLRALAMRQHFFFFDACRNDHQRLREMGVDGQNVLNPNPSYRAPAGLIAPIVYATGTGSAAWAPTDPKKGISLYGRAVLEALEAREGFKPQCTRTRCEVTTFDLAKYANTRVEALLKKQGARVEQPVRLGGASGDVTIAFLPPTAARKAARAAGGGGEGGGGGGAMIAAPRGGAGPKRPRGDAAVGPVPQRPRRPREPRAAAAPAVDDMKSITLPKPDWHPLTSPRETHSVLGSEYVSALWESAHVFNLRSKKDVPAKQAFVVHAVTRNADATAHIVTVEMQTSDPYWFELRDGNTSYVCTLPGDSHLRPQYVIQFSRIPNEGLKSFEARLSTDSPDVLGLAARLWEKYRAMDIVGATSDQDMHTLEAALQGKMQSALGAVIAGIMLLRAQRYEMLHDWLANLARFFPDIPDGATLWAEHMMRTDIETAVKGDVFATATQLLERGLPYTAEAFGYALRQVHELLEFENPRAAMKERLERLRTRLADAARVFRNTGLCSVFVGPQQSVRPAVILPD
jgi:hypothetical protein